MTFPVTFPVTLAEAFERETARLLNFTVGSRHPRGGFAWLNVDGTPDLDRPVETWITCRMTHVLALGVALGHPDFAPLLDHGIEALCTILHDDKSGGWFAASDQPNDGEKKAYDHAFVALAASSAVVAGSSAASALLESVQDVILTRFFDDSVGRMRDIWSRDWAVCEPYRGANANMHSVEAFLALGDVTGDRTWLDRALRIATFFIDEHARHNDWRIPEHFDPEWGALPEYNADNPAHQFRPFGSTPGHGFEWSRLLLHLDHSLRTHIDSHSALTNRSTAWLGEASAQLFDRAATDGWQTVNDSSGFVYTTDWNGRPVVDDRLHWVLCEAIAAAGALYNHTGKVSYADQLSHWWSHAQQHYIDLVDGSWHHVLDNANKPIATVWSGKPDTYHAIQAMLLPRLPLAPSLATALAQRSASTDTLEDRSAKPIEGVDSGADEERVADDR